jgi:hypothetical protein
LKRSCSGPWKSAEPVVSRPREVAASYSTRVSSSPWVEGLDAVEPGVGEGVQRGQRLVHLVEVPERMRPDGDAAGRVYDLDRLRDGRPAAGDVGLRPGDQVGREEGVAAVDALVGQPPGVGRVGEHGIGQVGAADRLAGPPARLQGRVVQLEAQLAQAVGHVGDPAGAVAAEVVQRGLEVLVGVVELVAEDVQILVRAVDGRELGGGREGDAVLGGGLARLGHAVDRVVVRQRDELGAGRGGVGDDVSRRQGAV